MNLDCNSTKGRHYIAEQNKSCEIISRKYGVDVFITPDDSASDVDCLLYKNKKLVGIAEIKSRNMSHEQLKKFGDYLITFEKLLKGRDLSIKLNVPFLLFVSLLEDNKIIYWKITDKNGNFIVPFACKNTQTQATCNGGNTERFNAYIGLESAKII